MSTETLEQLKAIRDGKIGNSTHVDSRGNYLRHDENRDWFIYTCKHGGHRVIYTSNLDSVRSLKDIEDKIELMERNQYLAEMIKYGIGEQDLQRDI